MSTESLDNKPHATREKIVENLSEPSNSHETLEEFPPRELREAGLTRGGTPHAPQSNPAPQRDS